MDSGSGSGAPGGRAGGRAREYIDTPSRTDRFVGGVAEVIGGPLGDHAARESAGGRSGRFWSAGRVVLAVTCLTLALHWVQKSPCRQGETWAGYGQLSQFCYSDVIALYGAAGGLSQGGVPYLDYPLEYPVLTGVLMAVIGLPVHALGTWLSIDEFRWFYDLHALALGAGAVATVMMILALRRRRPWDALMFGAAPALLLTATVNWDLLAVALAVAGLLAWARHRPVLAGVLLGLGTAAKLWPGFLFLPLIFLAFRTRRHRPVWTSVAVGVATWLAVNLPVMLADLWRNGSLDNWGRFLELNTTRAVDWGTFWYVGQYLDRTLLGGSGPFQWLGGHVDPYLNWLTYGLFGLACAGIAVLAVKAPRPPRVAALAFLTVAAFLLFNKVWSQQFVLWLLPLVVLARPRWGAFLAWQAAEVGYFFAFYGQLIRAVPAESRPEHLFVIPEGWFILAATLRWGTVAMLCALVISDILHPAEDVVRRDGADPDAGPLAGDPPDRSPSDGEPPGPGDAASLRAGRRSLPGSAEPEDHRAVDLLADDVGGHPGRVEGGLVRGADHPVGQDDDGRHPERA